MRLDMMERNMWLRKQNRPRDEAAAPVDANVEPSAASDPGAQTPSSFSIADPQQEAPNASLSLRVWKQQIARFDPNWRRLARKSVIGLGAPRSVSSKYDLLRGQIIKALGENDWSTVALTSPSRGSGTTLTAINLAISLARDFNHTVVLAELDLIAPSFQRILGFKRRPGIADYLLDDAPPSELLLDIGVDRLVVIPAGEPVANSSALLSSPKMARFVTELKGLYARQIILFDLPSVLAFDDATAFAPMVDCALLVVEEGETRVSDVRRAIAHLESTKILGTVLNRSIHGGN
jgi:protein-tyrosine kinase